MNNTLSTKSNNIQYSQPLINGPVRKDTHHLKSSAAGMWMPSLQGGIHGGL